MRSNLCIFCCLLLVDQLLLMSAQDQSRNYQCGHPSNKEICFEQGVKSKLVFAELGTAVLRCVVRNLGRHVVTWMKNDGDNLPLTVGKSVFTGDSRIMIDYSSPDEWNLVIRRVYSFDSGEYLCQVTADNGRLLEKAFMLVVQDSESNNDQKKIPQSPKKLKILQQSAEKSAEPSKRLLNDDPERFGSTRREKTVHIFGRRLVFLGEQFVSLTCTAVFRTSIAKRNPTASVEWYHGGRPQVSNASVMDVSMSWKDGDTAVSVLTIYSVGPGHAGEWLCLKRPSEATDGGPEAARHRLTVLEREYTDQQQKQQQQQQQRQLTQVEFSSSSSSTRLSLAISAISLFISNFLLIISRLPFS